MVGGYRLTGRAKTLVVTAVTAGLLIGVVAAADAAIWYVTETGSGGGGGTSWSDAAPSTDLQAMIDGADGGDQVWVAEGIYKPEISIAAAPDRTASFTLKEGVALYGGFPPGVDDVDEPSPAAHVTTLSGNIGNPAVSEDNCYHVISCDNVASRDAEGNPTLLDGFTVTGGNGMGTDAAHYGGGIFLNESSPVITDCAITGNSSALGGGIHNTGSSPVISGCTFSDNYATWSGGGISNHDDSGPTVTDCVFVHNRSGINGGGMETYLCGEVVVSGCIFNSNAADFGAGLYINDNPCTVEGCEFWDNAAADSGGGLYTSGEPITVDECAFSGNSAEEGGGLACYYGNPEVRASTFDENTAKYGGGMYTKGGAPAVTNCTFYENAASRYGGGAYNIGASLPTFVNCTFSDNSAGFGGSGVYNGNDSDCTFTNCILWNHHNNEVWNNASNPTITYCVVSEDMPNDLDGSNAGDNLNGDPLLNPLADNGGPTETCAIEQGSSARDAADSAEAPAIDQRGEDRPSGDGDDIGAFELHVSEGGGGGGGCSTGTPAFAFVLLLVPMVLLRR